MITKCFVIRHVLKRCIGHILLLPFQLVGGGLFSVIVSVWYTFQCISKYAKDAQYKKDHTEPVVARVDANTTEVDANATDLRWLDMCPNDDTFYYASDIGNMIDQMEHVRVIHAHQDDADLDRFTLGMGQGSDYTLTQNGNIIIHKHTHNITICTNTNNCDSVTSSIDINEPSFWFPEDI